MHFCIPEQHAKITGPSSLPLFSTYHLLLPCINYYSCNCKRKIDSRVKMMHDYFLQSIFDHNSGYLDSSIKIMANDSSHIPCTTILAKSFSSASVHGMKMSLYVWLESVTL